MDLGALRAETEGVPDSTPLHMVIIRPLVQHVFVYAVGAVRLAEGEDGQAVQLVTGEPLGFTPRESNTTTS